MFARLMVKGEPAAEQSRGRRGPAGAAELGRGHRQRRALALRAEGLTSPLTGLAAFPGGSGDFGPCSWAGAGTGKIRGWSSARQIDECWVVRRTGRNRRGDPPRWIPA